MSLMVKDWAKSQIYLRQLSLPYQKEEDVTVKSNTYHYLLVTLVYCIKVSDGIQLTTLFYEDLLLCTMYSPRGIIKLLNLPKVSQGIQP